MAVLGLMSDVTATFAFDHQPRTRLVFGCGTLDRVGELAQELGGRRVLLVTDPGIVRAGHARRATECLTEAGLAVATFADVRPNPTTLDVDRCVTALRAHAGDLLIGLGGGSSLDTAKGANFIATNGGVMQDYWGVGKATRPMLPLIAIPTTAGTGSECQSAALIADERTHRKMACLDPKAAARVAILDPELTVSQPPRVTACTGIDALAHALETAVARKRNAVSSIYSREAFRLLVTSLGRVLAAPGDVEARGRMLLGAAFAGTAIENSMLGAAHAAANPLTAHFGIVHGEAVGVMLPPVIRFNAAGDPEARHQYADLAQSAGLPGADRGDDAAVVSLVTAVELCLEVGRLPRALAGWGIDRAAVPELAAAAAREWTAGFNPRPVNEADFAALYAAVLGSPANAIPATR